MTKPIKSLESQGERPVIPPGRCRVRDLGLEIGVYKPGKLNAITDVGNVRVGHTTLISGKGKRQRGAGPVRTGVTAILPNAGDIFHERVVGSGFVLNGAGEVSGLTQVQEWGMIETPILLTNTLSVGSVSDATANWMVDHYPGIGIEHDVIIPLVGECDDSWLHDIAGRHMHESHVIEAIERAASGPVAEGNVGGGTGMITCDFKGGIGTSSRKLPKEEGGYTIGVLVMSNFGTIGDLRMDGIPMGRSLSSLFDATMKRRVSYGSIIAVLATDAPLLPHQLGRVSKRVALGIGRAGSFAAHGSGEIVLAFSTANRIPRETKRMVASVDFLLDRRLNPLYKAAMEATEEAILNALCAAEEMEGVDGHFSPALPLHRVREIITAYKAVGELASIEPEPKPPPTSSGTEPSAT